MIITRSVYDQLIKEFPEGIPSRIADAAKSMTELRRLMQERRRAFPELCVVKKLPAVHRRIT
jgi:hypothetical protein